MTLKPLLWLDPDPPCGRRLVRAGGAFPLEILENKSEPQHETLFIHIEDVPSTNLYWARPVWIQIRLDPDPPRGRRLSQAGGPSPLGIRPKPKHETPFIYI